VHDKDTEGFLRHLGDYDRPEDPEKTHALKQNSKGFLRQFRS